MPISSEQVSMMIAQQMGAQQAVHAQALQMSGGVAPNMYGSQLSPGGQVPSAYGTQMSSAASSVALGAMNIPGALAAIGGVAAMTGHAPALIDPFTAAVRYGRMWSGGSALGGIAAGAAVGGAVMGVGALASNFVLDPMRVGAGMMGSSMAFASQIFPQQSMASLMPFATNMYNMSNTGINTSLGNVMASVPELQLLAGQGLQSGQLSTRSMTQFNQQFGGLVSHAGTMAAALGTTINDAHASSRALHGIGITDNNAQVSMALTQRGLAHATGLSNDVLFSTMSAGAQAAKMAGISRTRGAHGAMMNLSKFSMIERENLIEGVSASDVGEYTNAGYKFLGSSMGSQVLAAMMDEHGGIDATMAQRISTGAISKGEIQRRARKVMNTDLFSSHAQELAAGFMSSYGAESLVRAGDIMTGDMKQKNTARQMMFGLNNEKLDNMRLMASGDFSNRVAQAAKEGLDAGMPGVDLSVGGQLSAAADQLTKGVKDWAREFGAKFTRRVVTQLESMSASVVGHAGISGDPYVFNKFMQAQASGDVATVNNVNSLGGQSITAQDFRTRLPTTQLLPRLFSAGHEGQSAIDMPAFGLLPSNSAGVHALAGLGFGMQPMGAGLGAASAGLDARLVAGRMSSKVAEHLGEANKFIESGTAYSDDALRGLVRASGRLSGSAGMETSAVGTLLAESRGALAVAKTGSGIGLGTKFANMMSGVGVRYGGSRLLAGTGRVLGAGAKLTGRALGPVGMLYGAAIDTHDALAFAGLADYSDKMSNQEEGLLDVYRMAGVKDASYMVDMVTDLPVNTAARDALMRTGNWADREALWLADGDIVDKYVARTISGFGSRDLAGYSNVARNTDAGSRRVIDEAGRQQMAYEGAGIAAIGRKTLSARVGGMSIAARDDMSGALAALGQVSDRGARQTGAMAYLINKGFSPAEALAQAQQSGLVGKESYDAGSYVKAVKEQLGGAFDDDIGDGANTEFMATITNAAIRGHGVDAVNTALRAGKSGKQVTKDQLDMLKSIPGHAHYLSSKAYDAELESSRANKRDKAVAAIKSASTLAGVDASGLLTALDSTGAVSSKDMIELAKSTSTALLGNKNLNAEALSTFFGAIEGTGIAFVDQVAAEGNGLAGGRQAWDALKGSKRNKKKVLESLLGTSFTGAIGKDIETFFTDKSHPMSQRAENHLEGKINEQLKMNGWKDANERALRAHDITTRAITGMAKDDYTSFSSAIADARRAGPAAASAKPEDKSGAASEKLQEWTTAMTKMTENVTKLNTVMGKIPFLGGGS